MKKHISINGYDFYVIYGEHDHGYYIAIPNWGICTEAAEPDCVMYNKEQLAFCRDEHVAAHAEEIAKAIYEYDKEATA